MKKIIVPTDFSQASLNALDYAIELFQGKEVKLILFHAIEYPVPIGMEYGIASGDLLTDQLNSTVAKINQQLSTIIRALPRHENITYEQMTEVGSLISWVKNTLPEMNPDLLVMGTTGASG